MKKIPKKRGKIILPKSDKSSFALVMIILMFILLLVMAYLISSYSVASTCINSKVQLSPGFSSNIPLISLSFIAFSVLGLGGWLYASKKQ